MTDDQNRLFDADPEHLLQTLRKSHLDQNLLVEFFFVFSRFEYALKRAGYVKAGNNRQAEPDWNRFGCSIEHPYEIEEDALFRRAADHLLSAPPKRQVFRQGELVWEEMERRHDEEIVWLLVLVRAVRNNLFHGGKYPYTPVPEPARDTELLRDSLTILRFCLSWDRSVGRYFTDDIE